MKTIIVPLDGSALAERVLPRACLLATALGARVRLVHILDMASHSKAYGALAADKEPGWRLWPAWEMLRDRAEGYLDTQASRLRGAGLRVEIEALFGAPAEAIIEAASGRHDTLIAMATHGYGGFRRWALGSVADQVVHASHVPVLLVRGENSADAAAKLPAAPNAIQRILVPLDGSDFARQALPLALDLAVGARAEVVALQSLAPSIEEYIGTAPPLIDLRAELRAEVSRAYAARDGRLCPEQAPVTPAVAVGGAAEAIVEEADRHHVDLIVMTTHGYRGLKRWMSGSVAEKVLRATTVPLLLVRAQVNEG
jgi:nucleotide-binding universal stress UspA family protein